MRKSITLIYLIALGSLSMAQTITPEEREKSLNLLLTSQTKLKRLTAGLTEEQLTFKPAEGRWSIKNNVDHLVGAEDVVWKIIANCLEKSGEGMKSDMGDDEFVKMLSTRGDRKFNAPERLKPDDDRYSTFADAMKAFDERHERTIQFVKSTDKDLRMHFSRSPMGMLDAYQWTLQIGAHTFRHIEQIEEILASDNFPRN